MRDLSKRLAGADFRKAVAALAVLHRLDPQDAARHIPAVHASDEQRDFQIRVARLMAAGGVQAVAAAWADLSPVAWREQLVTEIGQAFPDWIDEGTIELLLAALEDPEPDVARRAVGPLRACLATLTERDRRRAAQTQRGKAFLDAREQLARWLTAARRGRITHAVTARLRRHANAPKALSWVDEYIGLLGDTGTRDDAAAIDLLESFRPMAGEPRRSEFEPLDRDNLPWPTSILADRKGVPPGTPMMRVKSVPTGLLDLATLDDAIARIKLRAES